MKESSGLLKIFIVLSQITITTTLAVKIYGSFGTKDQGQINVQFSFKLCGDVRFHDYFSTLCTSGRSMVDYGKHTKGWNPM
jgi:plasmid maintenance system antidote protein VapI